MKELGIIDVRHTQVYLVPDFEQFDYINRIANTVVLLYMGLRRFVTGNSREEMEDRAITIADLIVNEYLKENLRYKPIGIKTGKKVNLPHEDFYLQVEANTHANFVSLHEVEKIFHRYPQYQTDDLVKLATLGWCGEVVEGKQLWICIKTTNPKTQKPLGAWEAFDTAIHEFTHFMDRISVRYEKHKNDIPLFRELLSIILKEMFIFMRE